MDKVGILIVSKCLSSAAIIDTFARSESYRPEFYVAEKQVNPLNSKRAKVHKVIPDLNVAEIVTFASRHKKKIAFGLTDTEDFVTAGGRDVLEKETGIQMLCVTKEFAVEASKADQRLLFEEICPEANPRYRVTRPVEILERAGGGGRPQEVRIGESQGFRDQARRPSEGSGGGCMGQGLSDRGRGLAVLPQRLLQGKGRRGGARGRGGVELPRLQRRPALRPRPPHEGLQARPRRGQGKAHGGNGQLQGLQGGVAVPSLIRVGQGGPARAQGLRQVEGARVEPGPPRHRPLRRLDAHEQWVQDTREEQQGREHRADQHPHHHARRLRRRLLQDDRRDTSRG